MFSLEDRQLIKYSRKLNLHRLYLVTVLLYRLYVVTKYTCTAAVDLQRLYKQEKHINFAYLVNKLLIIVFAACI